MTLQNDIENLFDNDAVKVRGRFQFDSRRIAEFAAPFVVGNDDPCLPYVLGGIRRVLNLEHYAKVQLREASGWVFIEFCGKTTAGRLYNLKNKVEMNLHLMGDASVLHVRTLVADAASTAFSFFLVRGAWHLAARRDVYQRIYETHHGLLLEPIEHAFARAEVANLKYAWFVPDE